MDKFLSLVETLLLLLHHTHLDRLVLLVAHHLLHSLSLKLLSALLNLDHFLVLATLCLQALSLTVVLLGLSHLLAADGLFLIKAVLLVTHLKFALLIFPLDLPGVLLVGSFSISLADVNDVGCFLLGLFNLLPCLLTRFSKIDNGHLPFAPPASEVQFYWLATSHLPGHVCEKLSGPRAHR